MIRFILFAILLFLVSLKAFPVSNDFEVLNIEQVGGSFQTVSFENSYTSVPVVVCTRDLNSSSVEEAVVRIRNRTTTGFELKLQKPLQSTSVTASTVYCLVATEGTHTLENGYTFEAHSVTSHDTSGDNANGWDGTGENVSSLIADHGSSPAVLGQVMSYNDPDFSVFWTYDCSNRANPPSGTNVCVGKHIGQSIRNVEPRAMETLGYIVIEEGTGGVPVSSVPPRYAHFEAKLGGDSIDGVDNNGASYSLSRHYDLGVATLNAMDGGDGGWAVLYGNDPLKNSNMYLAIDEDELGTASNEPERRHTDEQVAYWVFTEDPGLSWMEIKKISNVGGAWTTVNFDNNYTMPVAVCTYNLGSKNNNEAVVRMRNVGSSSMEIKLQRPKQGADVSSGDVYCIVMEEGNRTISGIKVEAHRVDSNKTNTTSDWSSSKMVDVNYSNSYVHPVVLGQVMTYHDPNWSVFWCSNGNRLNPPDSSHLYVGKHIGEEPLKYPDETLGFIIGAPHEGIINNIYYYLGRGSNSIKGVGDSPPYSYSFSSLAHKNYLYGVATQNGENGSQGGWAVLYGAPPVSDKIDLAIDEETVAGDTMRVHTNEEVAYWVFDPYPIMRIEKTSCVVNDPVNNGTNPKRIPGATIRYALQVINTGYRDAENVIADDNISSHFDSGTISHVQIQNGDCDCAGVSPADNNGPHGSVNGNEIKLDYETVPKGTVAHPSKKCGYFEVKIK